MREIKFRAWDKEKKKIVPIVDINWAFNGTTSFVTVWGVEKEEEGGYTIDFENCIIMQYTGLKDKNGKEIYEGDIVVDNGNITKPLYEISFYDYGFRLKGNTNLNGYTLHSTGKRLEVIGNIYENPELIKEA